MCATRDGVPFDAAAVRQEALACRAWLEETLAESADADATVVITHYAPSLRSADPRYGARPGTASFCNADDDLLPLADLWLHGHLHCRHDYRVEHPVGSGRRSTRVVSNVAAWITKASRTATMAADASSSESHASAASRGRPARSDGLRCGAQGASAGLPVSP